MIKNLRPRLASFVANRTQAPTPSESIQAVLVQIFAYTVIIGGILWISQSAEELRPTTPTEKAQIKKEQAMPNKPTFHTHKAEARKICKGKVVPAGDDKFADWVIVTKVNGKTVRMTLDRAFKLNQNQDTNVWVIGICKKDLLPPVVYK